MKENSKTTHQALQYIMQYPLTNRTTKCIPLISQNLLTDCTFKIRVVNQLSETKIQNNSIPYGSPLSGSSTTSASTYVRTSQTAPFASYKTRSAKSMSGFFPKDSDSPFKKLYLYLSKIPARNHTLSPAP